MVSALLNDALSDPASVLVSLQVDHLSDPASPPLPSRVAQHFKEIFKDDNAFKQIPALDITHPPESYRVKHLPLVRFRAMVQDTSASPEVYPSLLRGGKIGGWGLAEAAPTSELLGLQHLKEREVIWAVSVPGESSFVAEHLDDADLPLSYIELSRSEFRHKDPLMREKHVGVQVKLYDSNIETLKPTELHTFVGLLSFEHLLSPADEDSAEGTQVLTLHTLFSVKHPRTVVRFDYPALDRIVTPGLTLDPLPVSSVKDELVQWVADECLGGDCDAAHWVILVCIARVQSRVPPIFPPSLTLSKFPKPETDFPSPQTPALVHVLRSLLPLFVEVPLSLSLINSRPFFPESRDETLHSGLLQLPSGTTMLLSDSNVQEGKITEAGIKNIQALRNAMSLQTVDYHFPFASPYQFPTDLSFIYLTEGKESAFLQTQINVPMECKTPRNCFRLPEEISYPSPARMEAFRYLVGGAMIGDTKVTEVISQHIQADFVRERKESKATTADDLMTRMTIARLLATSLHQTNLTTKVWQDAKGLDQRRKQRCSSTGS